MESENRELQIQIVIDRLKSDGIKNLRVYLPEIWEKLAIPDYDTVVESMEEIDTLCTKYYRSHDMDMFRELNKIYHYIRKRKYKTMERESILFKLNTKINRDDIESNSIIMKISKYFENKIIKHPEYIGDLSSRMSREELGYYIPEGYEGWELKEYNGEGIADAPVLVSPNKEIILAPYKHGYVEEFIDDMMELYIKL